MSSDSGHWYDINGKPHHTIIGANGKRRNTTLADARKNGWLPSVTGIIGVIDKPQLTEWKMEQVAKQCFKQRTSDGWDEEPYVNEMIRRVKEDVGDSADFGTEIHKQIEAYFTEGVAAPEYDIYLDKVKEYLAEHSHEIVFSEKTLVNLKVGYAGTCDLLFIENKNGAPVYADFKTRRTKPGKPCERYESNILQIAAYKMADARVTDSPALGLNVIISSTEPGRVEFQEWTYTEVERAAQAFYHCAKVWQYQKNYRPPTHEENPTTESF